ncbi:MAG TPA: hypothetical protein VGK36_21485, partial [Candidatus Angelobacter sp.]
MQKVVVLLLFVLLGCSSNKLDQGKHTVRDGCDSVAFFFTVASKAVAEIQNIYEITSQKTEV